MASQKQRDLLSSGKKLWNTWRHEYPDVQDIEPDLHGMDLRSLDLHGTDLTEANLQKTRTCMVQTCVRQTYAAPI